MGAWIKHRAKAIIAVVGAALTVASGYVSPGSTSGHVIAIVLAALTAISVYVVPNAPIPVPAAVARIREAQAARAAKKTV